VAGDGEIVAILHLVASGVSAAHLEGIRWLASPVRNVIASPGRAELRLRVALQRHVTVRLWPDFDTTDLLIVFADGCRWAVDLKDCASPHLLARQLRPVPRSLEWDRAFIVPSRSSVESRPGYLRDLQRQSRERLRKTGVCLGRLCSRRSVGERQGWSMRDRVAWGASLTTRLGRGVARSAAGRAHAGRAPGRRARLPPARAAGTRRRRTGRPLAPVGVSAA
jgi:hypothetical protein